MNFQRRTDNTIETKPTVTGASWATRLVAIVISALVYGALVYLSRFTPRLFGIQVIYPAVSVGPVFGIWFQFWGALGLVLGTIISQLPAGLNPLIWIPANLAQSLYALLPALLYKKVVVNSWKSWLFYAAICILADILVQFVLLWNLHLNGYVPFVVGLRTLFPLDLATDVIWMVVLGPVILNVVSPYVVKSGLRFLRFF